MNHRRLKNFEPSSVASEKNDKLDLIAKEEVANNDNFEIIHNNVVDEEDKLALLGENEEETLSEEELLERRIKSLRPAIRPVVYNMAYFANSNAIVSTLIEMGVSVHTWDRDPSIGAFILKLDLERDVKPRLLYLHDLGIPPERHADVITANPHIFRESIDDLNVRIEYLRSKKFSNEAIREIVIQAPKWCVIFLLWNFRLNFCKVLPNWRKIDFSIFFPILNFW